MLKLISNILPGAMLMALLTFASDVAWSAAPTPTLCQPAEKDVFSCTTKARKTASLCASPDFSAKGGTLQYRFGTQAKVELQYPETPQPAAGKFFFSSTAYSGGGEAHIRFSNGGFNYTLFDRTIRTNFSGGKNNPAFSSGLVVRGPSKATTLGCVNDASIKSTAYEALPTEDFNDLD